ncbi:MAG: hypothetical protein PVF83_09830 [Anaerolineales bacterium]|jgi:hypothetical protein
MKDKLGLILIISLTLFCIIFSNIPSKEEKLAMEFGVTKDELSRYRYIFPYYYFDEKLEPGMSIKEVHEIIKGYEVMYDCGIDEIYYFYSTNQRRALRIMVSYGYDNEDVKEVYKEGDGWVNWVETADLHYLYIRGEDDDNWMLGVDGCDMIMPEDR